MPGRRATGVGPVGARGAAAASSSFLRSAPRATWQRTRAATEALFLMLDYAMGDLRYRRMQWRCNALNQRSRSAALRLGFKFEGIFYNHMILKGKNRDTAWYSILDTDWPAVREIIATWLSDDNFDADGLAQSSLKESMSNRVVAARG